MENKKLIETIDEDIKKQITDASNMFGVVSSVLFIGILMLFLYIAPDIATTIIKDSNKSEIIYQNEIKEFEKQYKKEFSYISENEYEKLENNGSLTKEIKKMYEISKNNPKYNALYNIAKLIIKFKVEDRKLEFILKILPYVIGVVLAGFLFTYRLHIIVAKELSMKKIDMILKIEQQEKINKDEISDKLVTDLYNKIISEYNAHKSLDDE